MPQEMYVLLGDTKHDAGQKVQQVITDQHSLQAGNSIIPSSSVAASQTLPSDTHKSPAPTIRDRTCITRGHACRGSSQPQQQNMPGS